MRRGEGGGGSSECTLVVVWYALVALAGRDGPSLGFYFGPGGGAEGLQALDVCLGFLSMSFGWPFGEVDARLLCLVLCENMPPAEEQRG